jgi:hypothetical protein
LRNKQKQRNLKSTTVVSHRTGYIKRSVTNMCDRVAASTVACFLAFRTLHAIVAWKAIDWMGAQADRGRDLLRVFQHKSSRVEASGLPRSSIDYPGSQVKENRPRTEREPLSLTTCMYTPWNGESFIVKSVFRSMVCLNIPEGCSCTG